MQIHLKDRKSLIYLYVILALIIVVKFLETLTPFNYADSLYYGMVIGKNLSWQSLKDSYLTVCGSFQSGLVEFLQAYPISKMGGNIWTQVTMQAMHFIFGQLLAGYILYKNIKDKKIAIIAFIAALTISVDSDFFLYSKTDGYLASLGLYTFFSIRKRNNPYIIGLLLGLIPLIKLSGLLITAPLSLYYMIKNRDFKNILKTAFVALALTSIILIRNYIFTGTPFYPALLKIFPGDVSQTPREYYLSALSSPINSSVLLRVMKDFFLGKMVFILIPFLIYKNKFKNIEIYLLSLVVFGIYVIINGGISASRFFFLCFFLNIFYIGISLEHARIANKQLVLLLILVLVDSKIDKTLKRDKENIKNIITNNYHKYRQDKIPLSKFWDYIPENSKILSDEFSQQFYAPKGVELIFGQCNKKFEPFRNCTEEAYSNIERFDYAILADRYTNKCFDKVKNNEKIYEYGRYKLYRIEK
ncbi:glycosyltransferase 87 family protein [Bacteriovorax sp. Seq25_V]|uniref:glycosyltransferase 87 family protein n=1 Tax=Bacteriovorax sp. Seq25_V TaxID=1201288 RepID=UPI000389E85C|nr:glycosyltransferase 87 family protein [Bacteriovorax sp. Seq25_V]EQC43427.1 PF09594 domain protein [Bacteriovorax sp. Seq25_V]